MGGGLAIIWRRNMSMQVLDSSQNFIDLQVFERGNAE